MEIKVSVSQFRNNISDYLLDVSKGVSIIIVDMKKNDLIAKVTAYKKFDVKAFQKALNQFDSESFKKCHPEWSTDKATEKWLKKSRSSSDRNLYHVPN